MKTNTRKIVGTALFMAIVFVLQHLAEYIKIGPFSITLVLAPIIVGAAVYGIGTGAILGLEFGLLVLLPRPIGTGDAQLFLTLNPVATIAVVILKGVLMGLAASAVYRLIETKNKLFAAIIAGITAPVVNTGVFVIGCWLFFMPTITEWATAAGAENAGLFVITGVVGINFLIELAINLVLSTVIVRIITIGRKESGKTDKPQS
ncbi:MAG: ECF transporter S component [Ruminococcaceae bacterium]|nr:ECF transporter S component [Oscillospiraceae bacterium]